MESESEKKNAIYSLTTASISKSGEKIKEGSRLADKEFPHDTSNWFSQLFFTWMNELISLGMKRPLEDDDLWTPDEKKKAHVWQQKLEAEWQTEKSAPQPSLIRAIWRLIGKRFIAVGMMRVVAEICLTLSPLIIRELVNFVTKPEMPVHLGYIWASVLFLLQVAASLLMNQFLHNVFLIALTMRAAFYGVIYIKSTKLSSASRQTYNAGKVTNIITSDVHRVEDFFIFGTMIWVAPLQVVAVVTLLCILLGWAALAGVALLVALIPLQNLLMAQLINIRKNVAPITDKRVNLTKELIEGIRVIKYFTWEKPFLGRISTLRESELVLVFQKSKIIVLVMVIAFGIPSFAATVTYAIFGSMNVMNAGDIFGSLALFQQLRIPLVLLPRSLSMWADFRVALIRIQGLLVADELENELIIDKQSAYGINIEEADFIWEISKQDLSAENSKENAEKSDELALQESAQFMLKGIDLKIKKGTMVAVVGAVGSGKSSLLNSLLGETKKLKGSVTFSGSVGYCSQEAWIQNSTIRDNILFGSPYDEEKYLNTLKKCQLQKDLEQFPDRDFTQIGERGVNLSGGQKQRVNFARLVYNSPDIILLDDPLSAVDGSEILM
jgi:ABC-type multidrug transport system fused ATPase/permease subunit